MHRHGACLTLSLFFLYDFNIRNKPFYVLQFKVYNYAFLITLCCALWECYIRNTCPTSPLLN